ncbi:MAG: arylesterase [Halobacteriovoraceae bacterium]|nr:arylesterase [Halobacteriovoraceae bacterium]|tara:strand:- start:4335 stop:4940 length:606 start_codon:yes stop_codon:yes gene_type:complete
MIKLAFFPLFILLCLNSVAFGAHKIVFIGDSLTEGYGIEQKYSYPQLVEQKLKKEGVSVEVINGGVSGSTSASGLSRLKWFLKSKPTHVFLALGANDGLRGLKVSETQKNLAKIIEMAQEKKIKVILAGMKMPPNYGKEYTADFKKIFPALAKKYDLPLVPLLIEKTAGRKEYNIQDGIHPNQKGHELIAQTVYPYIKKNL